MEQKWSELPDRAWVSLFWAQYSKLPEFFKKGFINLAQHLAQENGNKKKRPLTGLFTRKMEHGSGDFKT